MSAAKRLRTAPVDLLIVVCNPTRLGPKFTLPKAKEEADAVEKLAKKHGKRVEVRYSCTVPELRKLLAEEVRPRILLFIGHADARYKGEYTLGFTDAAGGLQKLDQETITKVVSNAPNLELVVFNGCKSAALGKAVVRRGLLVVCWETVVDDAAAALFTPALFDQLLHPDNDRVEMSRLVPKAFEQGKLAITTVPRLGGVGAKFAIDDPDKYFRHAECRIDPSDGRAYTLSEFKKEYGGTDEWAAAAPTDETRKETHGMLADGTFAAGVPLLPQMLDAVPTLPPQYQRRPDLEAYHSGAAAVRRALAAMARSAFLDRLQPQQPPPQPSPQQQPPPQPQPP